MPIKIALQQDSCVTSNPDPDNGNNVVLLTNQGVLLHLIGVPDSTLTTLLCNRVMLIGKFYMDALTVEVDRIRIQEGEKWVTVWDKNNESKLDKSPTHKQQ